MVTAFCKYEIRTKLLISFWTRAYSGLCRVHEFPPTGRSCTAFTRRMFMEYTTFEQNWNWQ